MLGSDLIVAATAPSGEILNRDGIMTQITSVAIIVVAALGIVAVVAAYKRNWLKIVGILAGIVVGGLFVFNSADLLQAGPGFAATVFNLGF
jgi:hypothetical protein